MKTNFDGIMNGKLCGLELVLRETPTSKLLAGRKLMMAVRLTAVGSIDIHQVDGTEHTYAITVRYYSANGATEQISGYYSLADAITRGIFKLFDHGLIEYDTYE